MVHMTAAGADIAWPSGLAMGMSHACDSPVAQDEADNMCPACGPRAKEKCSDNRCRHCGACERASLGHYCPGAVGTPYASLLPRNAQRGAATNICRAAVRDDGCYVGCQHKNGCWISQRAPPQTVAADARDEETTYVPYRLCMGSHGRMEVAVCAAPRTLQQTQHNKGWVCGRVHAGRGRGRGVWRAVGTRS